MLRQAADRHLHLAAQDLESVVVAAVDAWLTACRYAIITTLMEQRGLTAAGLPEAAVDAARQAWHEWRRHVDNNVLPAVAVQFGDAFQQTRLENRDQGSFAPQMEFMETVADRLRIWPDGAFEELRPELVEALAGAETIEQITDRVGMVLGIDADQRAIKARIVEVEKALDDPAGHGLDKLDVAELRAERRALWEEHDAEETRWRWKARRIARTESHAAVEAGTLAAARQNEADTGETWFKRWLATDDPRTRVSHRVADGQTVPLSAKFRVGGFLLDHPGDPITIAPHETINCFPADTPIDAPGLEASIRTPYVGPLVTVRMKSGGVLSGSPNHPVLTERGWVRLGELEQGDNLIRAAIGELDLGAGADPDVQGVPATIGEVHRALDAAPGVRHHRVSGSMVDFYGDRPSGEVEVVSANSELRHRLDAAHAQKLRELALKRGYPAVEPLRGSRAGLHFGVGSRHSPNGVMGGGSQAGAFLGGGLSHTGEHGVTPVPGSETAFDQGAAHGRAGDAKVESDRLLRLAAEVAADSGLGVEHAASLAAGVLAAARDAELADLLADPRSRYPELLSDLGSSLAGLVELDEVINVDVRDFSGHLFTVQTSSGMYLASSFIVRNCRCTLLIYPPNALQDALQGPDGSMGEVRPEGVRIGPDDPDKVEQAIVDVAGRESRALPDNLQARGEDHGQTAPAAPVDVELTDDRALPVNDAVPDLASYSDDDLLDLMAEKVRSDDGMYEQLLAEYDRRQDDGPPVAPEPPSTDAVPDAEFAALDDDALLDLMADHVGTDDGVYERARDEYDRRQQDRD
ncbi:MAG: phage minor head protein [Anaerolineae bacterium]